MDAQWGHCKNCRHFASPAARPLGSEEAACQHPSLSKFHLTVYGSCGCNGFDVRPGLPDVVERAPLSLDVP